MASTHDDSFAKYKLYIGGAIGAFILAILLDSCSTPSEEEKKAAAEAASAETEQAAADKAASPEENLKPIENLATVDKDAPAAPARSGKDVYQAACLACHAAGVLNAPKLEAGAWDDRIDKGLDGLTDTAIKGINSMPPRGGNPDITDEEMKNAVAYMLKESGYEAGEDGDSGNAAQATDSSGGADQAASDGGSATKAAVAAAATGAAATAAAAVTQAAEAPKAPEPPTAPEAPKAAQDTAQSQSAGNTQAAASGAGKKVYDTTCFTCHNVGIANSPILGDNAVWSKLAGAGTDALYTSALNGKGAMPPKGGYINLSDEQVTAAVDYMLQAANVSAPEAATQDAAPAADGEAASTEQAESTEQKAATETETEDASKQAQAAAPVAHASIDGEKVYRGICFSCHDTGLANAPKIGDKAAWDARTAAGIEAVYTNSINGKGAMPPKGGNTALSDDEIKAAVDWMIKQ